jgi:hypothetical protein
MSVTVSSPHAPQSDEGGLPSAGLSAPAAFGQFLAAARHRCGLTLEDISATTKVAVRHLEALERGLIDQLPGGVYRRAWVKGYAAAVGLPPDATIEQFDRMLAPPGLPERLGGVPPPAPAERPPATESPRPESRRQPPALPRPAVSGYRLLGWMLPAAALVAAASLAPLLRSSPAAPGDDSTVPIDDTGALAATPESGSRRSDIALVPDEIPEEPILDPRLVITTRPSGARVTVNGIGWGVTPITIRNLPPGPKLIRATKDGYIGREASVELGVAKSNETVRLILERRDGRVTRR